MNLYIIRHGETEENKQMILQGHLPGTLTDNGKQQIKNTSERLLTTGINFDCIISSDLQRAIDSAQIISSSLSIPIFTMAILRERNWGPYTGMLISEAAKRFKINGIWQFPNKHHFMQEVEDDYERNNKYGKFAETEEEIFERAKKALIEIKNMYKYDNIIIVTHGQFARNMIAAKFDCNYREVSPIINGEIRKITI